MARIQPTPEAGDIWRDLDRRSVGEGEFEVMFVSDGRAHVHRKEANRTSVIRVERMTSGRHYERIGKSR